jgi:hypothetical protein
MLANAEQLHHRLGFGPCRVPQVGSFEMKVRRANAVSPAVAAPAPAPAAAAAPAYAAPETLVITKAPAMDSLQTLESMDESLVHVTSPKVRWLQRWMGACWLAPSIAAKALLTAGIYGL